MSSTVSGIASSRASISVRVAEQAGEAGAAAGEAEAGRGQPPALRRSQVSSAGRDQLERAAVERAAAADPVAARRDVGDAR